MFGTQRQARCIGLGARLRTRRNGKRLECSSSIEMKMGINETALSCDGLSQFGKEWCVVHCY